MQVAIEKTKGNNVKAIELLKAYVDIFMTDRDAWSELGDLYLEVPSNPLRLLFSQKKRQSLAAILLLPVNTAQSVFLPNALLLYLSDVFRQSALS